MCFEFNPESYKPYQWDWDAQTEDFHNIPRLQCPRALHSCVCKSDLRKSMYLVDCGEHTIQLRDIYHLPHNTTHFRSYRNGLKTLS